MSFNEEWVKKISLKEFLRVCAGARGWSEKDLEQAYYEIRGEKPKKKEEGGE